jgi:hypothetical protein
MRGMAPNRSLSPLVGVESLGIMAEGESRG